MKYALDTNVIIYLCNSKEYCNLLVDFCNKTSNIITVQTRAKKEFENGAQKTDKKEEIKNQIENFKKIESHFDIDWSKWFRLDESTLDGPDMLASECFCDFNSSVCDEKYQNHLRDAEKPKSREKLSERKQGDADIYSWAVENNCDYLVTDNIRDFIQISAKYYTKLLSCEKFIEIVRNSLMQNLTREER